MSKGSKQRPRAIDTNTFEDNWDVIFNKDKKTYKEVQQDLTELNSDSNRTRGRNGEDNDKSNSSL
tara:strand:- start:99 stop:293 length:195 start_codon:yes stop_codon:yes gene_type:complete